MRAILLSLFLFSIPPLAGAQGVGAVTVTSQVGVTVSVEATFTILPSLPVQAERTAEDSVTRSGDVTMLTSPGNLSDYTGTTSFTYFIRTGKVGGSGFIKLQVTTDFSPRGGPSVGSPLTAGDTLRYACAVSSPGTACSGLQLASIASQTPVATFASDAHSAKAGSTASIAWVLSNDPLYQTGTYTAIVTYTISAS